MSALDEYLAPVDLRCVRRGDEFPVSLKDFIEAVFGCAPTEVVLDRGQFDRLYSLLAPGSYGYVGEELWELRLPLRVRVK